MMALSTATDRLLFLHVSRTGGMLFINVLRNIEGLRVLPHTFWRPSYRQLASVYEKAGLDVPPAVVFVRNPWAWYVAVWAWVCATNYMGMRRPFKDYMDTLQSGCPEHPPFWTLTEAWRRSGADNAALLGRFENLHDDIVRIVSSTMADLVTEDETREIMRGLPRYHPSLDFAEGVRPPPRIKHYSEYYDGELRQRVDGWDAELIERFGYQF